MEPLGGHDRTAVEATLGALAHSATSPNLTTAALAAALPGATWTVSDEVPFTSSLRWSGATTGDGSWVLGAPEALLYPCWNGGAQCPDVTRCLLPDPNVRPHRGLPGTVSLVFGSKTP